MAAECGICRDTCSVGEALLLPCLHTVCVKCTSDLQQDAKEQQRDKLICVVCGEAFAAEDLLLNVTASVDDASVPASVSEHCTECADPTPSTHHCPKCSTFFCDLHSEAHRRSKTGRSHELTLLRSSSGSESVIAASSLANPNVCKTHRLDKDNAIIAVCMECHQVACVRCLTSTHLSHRSFPLDKALESYASLFQTGIATLSESQTKLDTLIDDFNVLYAILNNRLTETTRRIHMTFDPMIQQLQRKRDVLLSEARKEIERDLKTLRLQHENLALAKDCSVNVCQQATALQRISEASPAVLSVCCTVANRLNYVNNQAPDTTPLVTNLVIFARPTNILPPPIISLCSVRRARDYTQISQPVHILGAHGNGNRPSTLANPTGLSVDEHANLVIADRNNKRILVWSVEGVHIRTLLLNDITPSDVASGSFGRFWVASRANNGLLHVSETGATLQKMNHKEAAALAVMANSNVIVCGSNAVRCFAQDTTELWCYQSEGSDFPGLTLSNDETEVLVTDWTRHEIKVISSMDGRLLRQLGSKILYRPRGIAVTPDDFIVVTDSPNANDHANPHSVSILTQTGERVHTWGGEKGSKPGEFDRPFSVAILPDGLIAISDHSNSRIQIF